MRDARDKGRLNNTYDKHGEANPNAKLTQKDIPMIREMRAQGATYKAIANRFGIGIAQARNVALALQWKGE